MRKSLFLFIALYGDFQVLVICLLIKVLGLFIAEYICLTKTVMLISGRREGRAQ